MWNPDTTKISGQAISSPRALQPESLLNFGSCPCFIQQHGQPHKCRGSRGWQVRPQLRSVHRSSAQVTGPGEGRVNYTMLNVQVYRAFYFILSFLFFLKDKGKALCENITMETSWAPLYLPAKWLPNWTFTSYWIAAGHLLSFKLLWIPYFPEKFIFRKEEGGGKGRIQHSWLAQSYCEKGRQTHFGAAP